MAEERIIGHAAVQRSLEGVYIVDALSVIRAFIQKILVYVGSDESIGVDSTGAGKNALEDGSFAIAWQGRGHPRLQDRMALRNAQARRISEGQLSGCAIFPTRRAAVPLGRRVSASRVIT